MTRESVLGKNPIIASVCFRACAQLKIEVIRFDDR
jgi:hypothetical protein